MLNQVVIAGRLTDDPVVNENEKGKCYITVAVPRSYKNVNGEYDTDYIECICYNFLVEKVQDFCKKGDIVGIKGRLQTNVIANDDGEIIGKTTDVIVEKLSFLSTSHE